MDVVIVGGGLVGCSLAIALQGSGLRVALVESQAGAELTPPSFDERNLALGRASLNALQALDVLPRLPRAPAPIERIHVSRHGDFGAVRLSSAEFGHAAFGGVVMARDLGWALEQRVKELGDLQRLAPARLWAFDAEGEGWRLQIEQAGTLNTLHARLLVAADGSGSAIRGGLGIAVEQQDYGQTLIVSSLRSTRAVDGSAWERFSDTGPVALLPRNDGRLGAVCGVARAEVEVVMALNDAGYIDYLQHRFGYRAGRFLEVGRRVAYPLHGLKAQSLLGERAVLIGNAAQTLHPIGAQGFNLGLRDALCLAEQLAKGGDPGDASRLLAYAEQRREDREQTWAFSDGLARLTSSRAPAAHLLRSFGLMTLERSVSLRGQLVSGAMGFRGAVPKLARGAA